MKYIVDTHVLLWTLLEPAKLSKNILQAYDQADEIQVSNINFWEISLKYKLEKLDLGDLTPHDLLVASKESHFKVIEIDANIMSTLYQLPLGQYKDPFDRILIWYAIQNKIPLISRDSLFGEYEHEGLKIVK